MGASCAIVSMATGLLIDTRNSTVQGRQSSHRHTKTKYASKGTSGALLAAIHTCKETYIHTWHHAESKSESESQMKSESESQMKLSPSLSRCNTHRQTQLVPSRR
jgi:hypothetical protein